MKKHKIKDADMHYRLKTVSLNKNLLYKINIANTSITFLSLQNSVFYMIYNYEET